MPQVIALNDQHKDAVVALIREAHGPCVAEWHKEVWNWKFNDNPRRAADQQYQVGLIEDGKLLGTVAIMPSRTKVAETVHAAGILMDNVVSTSARRRGIAGVSLKICREAVRISPTVVLACVDDRNLKLWQRIFGHEAAIGQYRRSHRIVALAPVLRSKCKMPAWLASVAGAAHSFATRMVDVALAYRTPRDVEIRPIEEFGDAFDALWASAGPSHENITVRDAQFAEWRFQKLPNRRYAVLGAYRGDRLVGYVALRTIDEGGTRKVLIVDIFCHAAEIGIFRQLIVAALGEARRSGAAVISMLELHSPVLRRELLLSLFFTNKRPVWLIAHSNTLNDNTYRDRSKWWVTLADADLELTS